MIGHSLHPGTPTIYLDLKMEVRDGDRLGGKQPRLGPWQTARTDLAPCTPGQMDEAIWQPGPDRYAGARQLLFGIRNQNKTLVLPWPDQAHPLRPNCLLPLVWHWVMPLGISVGPKLKRNLNPEFSDGHGLVGVS